MVKMTKTEIVESLKSGNAIDYAFFSGGIILAQKASNPFKYESIKIGDFLDLRSEGVIEKTRRFERTHPVFHGQVDRYEIVKQP